MQCEGWDLGIPHLNKMGRYASGQSAEFVKLSSFDFEGSNPSRPTKFKKMDNIQIGDSFNDRWSTFYVFDHKDVRRFIACDVLFLTIMADDEKRQHIMQKDRYHFDVAKAAALLQRAAKKGRMNEVIDKSNIYDGHLNAGSTFSVMSKVVDVSEGSVQMEIDAVTRMGIRSWQWFDRTEFNKRFTT